MKLNICLKSSGSDSSQRRFSSKTSVKRGLQPRFGRFSRFAAIFQVALWKLREGSWKVLFSFTMKGTRTGFFTSDVIPNRIWPVFKPCLTRSRSRISRKAFKIFVWFLRAIGCPNFCLSKNIYVGLPLIKKNQIHFISDEPNLNKIIRTW